MGLATDSSSELSLNQFPGLMVPGGIDNYNRKFLRFNHDNDYFDANSHSQQLHVPHGHVCRGSAYGWLFLIDDELNTKLLNPFSSEEIQLPSASTLPPPASEAFNSLDKWYVNKAVFSSNPSLKNTPPIVLVIHGGHTPRLAYCKPGDKTWTSLHSPNLKHYYLDAIFYNDQFYALNHPGCIVAYDIGRRVDDDDHSVKVTQIAPAPPGLICMEDMFLVEVDGELIKLTKKVRCDEYEYEYDGGVYESDIYGFEMQKFDSSEEKWMNVESLGDKALFLGYNTSFSVSASEFSGCIPNSIYFTNGSGGCEAAENNGHDMGIFNLTDKSIKPLYPINDESELTKPSPIWVADANALKIEMVAARRSRL